MCYVVFYQYQKGACNMAYSEAQKKASRKYNENNYKRINMYLLPKDKERWETEAKAQGISLSEFIKQCVNGVIAE